MIIMRLTSESTDKITIGQFMEEATFFERSQEYMDLIKESYEVELMERYCECQEFIMENADSIDDEIKAELMTEAAGGELAVQPAMLATVEKKKSGIWAKIKSAVKKIITAIVTLFSRLVKFWKNGDELEALRAVAKQIDTENKNLKADKQFAKEDLDEAAKKIESLLHSKAQADETISKQGKTISKQADEIKNLKIVGAQKDAEIARVHKMFKGVNPGLYKELQQVEMAIAESIDVYMPQSVSEIDDYTKEVASVVESYKVIRGKYAGNANLHKKHARNIAATLNKLRASKNQMAKVTISGSWLEEVYKGLSANKERIQKGMDEITATFNDAQDTTNRMDTSKSNTVHKIRVDADHNYMEVQRNLTMLLNEWIYLANTSLKSMKELMDIRSHNLKMEAQILSEIKKAVA